MNVHDVRIRHRREIHAKVASWCGREVAIREGAAHIGDDHEHAKHGLITCLNLTTLIRIAQDPAKSVPGMGIHDAAGEDEQTDSYKFCKFHISISFKVELS